MKMLQHITRKLPVSVRQFGRPVKKGIELWRSYRCGLWILSGRERHRGEALTVAYAGTDYSKNYFVGKMFADGFEEQVLGRHWVFRALNCARRKCANIALFVCEVPTLIEKVYQPEAFATVPAWIRMEAKLGPGSRVWGSRKFLEAERGVKREGFRMEVVRDVNRFDTFYRHTYLPYIRARHGSGGVTDSPELAVAKFLEGQCELLLVTRSEELLGGIVVNMRDGVERIWWLAGSISDHANVGSYTDILYYFAIIRGRDSGCELLNMGHCRSLLSDGLMWYKREWGGVLLNDRSIYDGQIALRLLKESNAVKSFLRHNPFVGTDKNERFDIHCFVDGTEEGDADVERWRSRYCNSGKVGLRVFTTVPHIQFRSETDRAKVVSSDAVAMSR